MSSFDITFCPNKDCPKRQNCERNSDRLKNYPYPVSMAGFAPDENGECEYYCPIKEEDDEDDIVFDRDASGKVTLNLKNQEL